MRLAAIMPSFAAFLKDGVYAQKDRLVLWAPVCFALGIGLYFSLAFEPALLWGVAATGLSFAALWAVMRFQRETAYYWPLVLGMAALLLASSGFLAAQIRTHVVHTPLLEGKTGIVDMTGIVHAIDDLPGDAARLLLSDVALEGVEEPPRFVRVKVHDRGQAEVGARVALTGILNPPSAPVVPGGFDFARHMYFQGIGGVGFAFHPPEILQQARQSASVNMVEQWRQGVKERIYAALPEEQAAIAAALITGHKTGMREEDKEAMRASGLAHLLAISGLHIGLVSGILFFASRLVMAFVPALALNYPIKKYAAFIALCGACFYMVLAGATIPTQRALLMTGVVLFAVFFDRMAISLRLVAFAAFVVLLLAPESLLSVSFQLSFAAVTALVAFYDALRPWFEKWAEGGGILRRIGLYFLGLSLTSVIATLATMIFALYHFEQVARYGLLGNLVAVPLMGFWVMPAGIVALLLMPFGLDHYAFALMGYGIEVIVDTARWVEALPGSVLSVSSWPFAGFLALVCAGLWLCLVQGRARLLCLVPVMIGVIWIGGHRLPDILVSSNLELIASRQGDAYVISSKRAERFTRENWERYLGLHERGFESWPETQGHNMRCDVHGCRTQIKGRRVSFVKDFYAQPSACEWADIVIAQEPVRVKNCAASTVIGRFDGWRNGAHSLYLTKGGVRVRSVQQMRGDRPWVFRR